MIKLVIFDLDNTLTTGPTIWELVHREHGTWHTHGLPYWKAFKQGKFGFNAFIRKDVACWKGLSVKKLKKAIRKIKYISGIKRTMAELKKRKIKTALISSSIELFAKAVAKKFGIDYVFANPLKTNGHRLTGKVDLKIPGMGKGRITKYLRACLHFKRKEIMAIGDSHFDLPMFQKVGTAITFTDARPAVRAKADQVISKKSIGELLRVIDNGR